MSQHTLGSSGSSPDFTDIDSWVSWVQANKVSGGHLTEDVTLDVLPGGYIATSGDTISGWDSSGGVYTTRLTALGSHSFTGNASYSSNALFYNSSNGAFIDYSASGTYRLTVSVPKFRMDRLQFKFATENYQLGIQVDFSEAQYSEISGNIFSSIGNPSREANIVQFSHAGANLRPRVYNNVFHTQHGKTACVSLAAFVDSGQIYHNTFVALNTSITVAIAASGYASTLVFANNVFIDIGAFGQGNHGTDNTAFNNATNLSSIGNFNSPTGSITNISASTEFEGGTSLNDFRIKSTSVALKTGGAGGYLTTDIGGVTRSSSAPSIGAWEFVSGAGSITGTVSATEVGDAPSIGTALQIAATIGISEVDDVVTCIAALNLLAQTSITETADVLSAEAALQIVAAAEAVQADGLSASGTQSTGIGMLSATETTDNASATAFIQVAATFASAEATDNISAISAIALLAQTSITEAADAFGAMGANLGPISAGLIIVTEGDALAAFGRRLWISQSAASISWIPDTANDTVWLAQTPSLTSWTGH